MELTRKDWSLGWIPSDDFVGGRENGLLRMDNLYTDEHGVVSLVNGTQSLGSFGAYVHSCFSTYFGPNKKRFVGLGDGSVKVVNGPAILTGGNSVNAAFANLYGFTFVSSGAERWKWDGSSDPKKVGIKKPGKPSVTLAQSDVLEVMNPSAAQIITGSRLSEGEDAPPDADPNEMLSDSGFLVFNKVATTSNLNSFLGGTISGRDTDRFTFSCRFGDTAKIGVVRICICLDSLDAPDNYYAIEFSNEDLTKSDFNQGRDMWTTFTWQRKDFVRYGGDGSLDWGAVNGVLIAVTTTEEVIILPANIFCFGGEVGPIAGGYQYIMRASAEGPYAAKSGLSEPSDQVTVQNSKVTIGISPSADEQVTHYEIFRRSTESSLDVVSLQAPPKLDKYYRIAVVESTETEFVDTVSDQTALLIGISVNPESISLLDLPDEVLDMCPVFQRMLYMTFKEIIISDNFNPDSYVPRLAIRLSGTSTASNFFMRKVDNNRILIGTSEDLYELAGTFNELPDGSLDVRVTSIGVGNKPVSKNTAIDNGVLYYLSAMGWTALAATTDKLLSSNLDLLFRNESRHEYPKVIVYPNGQTVAPVVIYRNQLWGGNTYSDGSRRLIVHDLQTGVSHPRLLEPLCLFIEDDGTLIGGFGGGSGNHLRQLDYHEQSLDGQGQVIELRTVCSDNGQPRNRKDFFTLKITANTGGSTCEVAVAKDGTNYVVVGQLQSSAISTQSFQVFDTLGVGTRVSVRIKCTSSTEFKLYNYTFEYDTRPEQLNYLRIPPTNLGVAGRKRFVNYPLIIDTLGHTLTLKIFVDGVLAKQMDGATSDRRTLTAYFDQEVIGIDIQATLSSGTNELFEFYELALNEIISEKMPVPVTYLRIPMEDFGSPNRKRHSSYKFRMNTRGGRVQFTPRLDSSDLTPLVYQTDEKKTCEYFFRTDTAAIDIGGELVSMETPKRPFEFYGVIVPQQLEILPSRLQELYAQATNFGIPAPKRVRTIPMVIDTYGFPVLFTPIVDGQPVTPGYVQSAGNGSRNTVFHYFDTDIFGTDFGGEFTGEAPFEFYEFLKPASVEILPVGKKFDQVGPFTINKLAKWHGFRIRVAFSLGTLPFTLYVDNVAEYSGTVVIDRGEIGEHLRVPKTIKGTTFRLEIGPSPQPFFRYFVEMKLSPHGNQTENQWLKLGSE